MSYRAFRKPEDQAAAESDYPERFDDGRDWITLAERAQDMGDLRKYTADEWQALTAFPATAIPEGVTASMLWMLGADYEAARLAARYVTLDGLATIKNAWEEAARAIRATWNPVGIRGLRAALFILDQATKDPDRRRTWSGLARDLDIISIASYRPYVPPPPVTPAEQKPVAEPAAKKPAPEITYTPAARWVEFAGRIAKEARAGKIIVNFVKTSYPSTKYLEGFTTSGASAIVTDYNYFLDTAAGVDPAEGNVILGEIKKYQKLRAAYDSHAYVLAIGVLADSAASPKTRRRLAVAAAVQIKVKTK